MALTGSKRDWLSAYPGTQEFDWFWGTLEGLISGDQYGTGPVPMPTPRSPVPVVISEVPETWEEYEAQYPEYFEPILETRPGRTPDPYPQDVSGTSPAQDDLEEDEVAHTWMHIAREFVGGMINPAPSLPMNLAPGLTMGPVGPSTPANQAATAAAMDGCDGMTWSGGAPPKGYKVVNSCGVGVLRKVRRRRRRRILSASDASDIATIVGLVGKGQMASSLINRRS